MTQYVYRFGGGVSDGGAGDKTLLGGKGANLDGMAAIGLPVVSVRCQGAQQSLFALLVAEEYRVHWTDLRLTYTGHAEPPVQGVLLSNWEI